MTDHIAYIGLGSNCGDRSDNIRKALSELDKHSQITLLKTSSLCETLALGPQEQPDFINAVAQIRLSLPADTLLQAMHSIEQQMGRQRNTHWEPRTVDLDLLLYDDAVINEADITVPHSQMHLRSFVLKGLCELNPDMIHPVLDRSAKHLYERLNGKDFYLDDQKPQLISIAGNIGVGKTTLASRLANLLFADLICEQYDDNPYLSDVYAGKTELALDSELFFLSSGASQLRKDRMFSGRRYVSDYVFDKALIYASGWLSEEDLKIYRNHYQSVQDGVISPVLVLYLQDSLENCLERIHLRNRPYEQKIELSFLEYLARGYDALYTDYAICPVIRLRSDDCRTPEQAKRIANEIQHYIIEIQE